MTEAMVGMTPPAREHAPGGGLPSQQVQAWLDSVRADLERVRARIDFMQVEEERLEEQHRLLAELLASSL